jgi:hypothetical protein
LPFIIVIRARYGEILERRDSFDALAAAEQVRVVTPGR